ncbi:prepilin-type N-terminal cleavage/methylation domain-containing protein [Thermodesulfobacteriota bacterium]
MLRTEGFTLLEIVAAITIAAILAALFVQFMGTAFMRSGEPVNTLQDNYEVNQVTEKLIVDYRNQIESDTLDLEGFNNALSDCDEDEVGVVCSGSFLDYRADDDSLIDSNNDQIYEAQLSSDPSNSNFLLVTVAKNDESSRVLFSK